MRSRGTFELARAGGNLSRIAHACGVSESTVSLWRSGLRTPSEVNRELLRDLLGIALEAWDEEAPEGERRPVPPVTSAPVTDLASAHAAIVAEAARQLAIIQQAVDAIASDPLGSPQEVIRATSNAAKGLAMLGKLTGATLDLSPNQLLASPAWRQLEHAIVEALEPWPEALLAVSEALTRRS